MKILYKFYLFILLTFSFCSFGDEITIIPKRNFSNDESIKLCELKKDSSKEDFIEILETPNVSRNKDCRLAAIEVVAWDCRKIKEENNFLSCTNEVLAYVDEVSVIALKNKLFMVGDLLVKQSKIYEAKGDYTNAVKSLEKLIFFEESAESIDSLYEEIGRLYMIGTNYLQAINVLNERILLLNKKSNTDASVVLSYIQTYIRYTEIKIAQKDYRGASKSLEKLNFYLLQSKNCWNYGWDNLLNLRSILAGKMGRKDEETYFRNMAFVYNRFADNVEELESIAENKKHSMAKILLSSIENDSRIVSFVCPFSMYEVSEFKKHLIRN